MLTAITGCNDNDRVFGWRPCERSTAPRTLSLHVSPASQNLEWHTKLSESTQLAHKICSLVHFGPGGWAPFPVTSPSRSPPSSHASGAPPHSAPGPNAPHPAPRTDSWQLVRVHQASASDWALNCKLTQVVFKTQVDSQTLHAHTSGHLPSKNAPSQNLPNSHVGSCTRPSSRILTPNSNPARAHLANGLFQCHCGREPLIIRTPVGHQMHTPCSNCWPVSRDHFCGQFRREPYPSMQSVSHIL